LQQLNQVICGDSVEELKKLPDNSVDLVVTSPPYDTLRSYKDLVKDMEEKFNGYSFPFEQIATELSRVVKKGGVVVWVVGDAVIKGSETGSSFRQALYFMQQGFKLHDTMIYEKNGSSFPARRDGNRYSQLFEYMFVFSNGAKPKTANLICDKPNRWAGYTHFGKGTIRNKKGELIERNIKPIPDFSPRNNIWKYNTGKNYSTKDKVAFEHPAIFPEALVQDHILTWTTPGDVVLDPFNGSGTTTKLALLNDRQYIGMEISSEYCDIAEERLNIARKQKETNK
jgi:site-specific DNA-methyltransferase (adenine-specific)